MTGKAARRLNHESVILIQEYSEDLIGEGGRGWEETVAFRVFSVCTSHKYGVLSLFCRSYLLL